MSEHLPIDPSERVAPPQITFEPAKLRERYDGWTAEKQIRFIEALAATKCVDEACRLVGMSDTAAYTLRNRPCGADFAKAWDLALDCQIPDLEQRAMDRARFGVPRPIFYKGEQVGEYRHFDERLTMFLLRSRRPERYGKALEKAPEPVAAPDYSVHALAECDMPISLGEVLEEIAINAPGEHGYLLDDWNQGLDVEVEAPADSRARVGQ